MLHCEFFDFPHASSLPSMGVDHILFTFKISMMLFISSSERLCYLSGGEGFSYLSQRHHAVPFVDIRITHLIFLYRLTFQLRLPFRYILSLYQVDSIIRSSSSSGCLTLSLKHSIRWGAQHLLWRHLKFPHFVTAWTSKLL